VNGKQGQSHDDCLRDEVLTDYLEGTLEPVTKRACEAHLITCDPCRQNLALFMKVLRTEVNPEEEAAVQQLTALWDRRNPRNLPALQRATRPLSRYVYGGVAAALVLITLFVGKSWWLGPSVSRAAQITRVLLEKDRPFEARIVGQPYMPIQEFTRSPQDVMVSDVLETEMTAQTKEKYEVGRFFLLNRKYQQAIKYLKEAVADPKGVPADVHNDLGVAYLESSDTAAAESQFKDALSRNSAHPQALFNISILYKRQDRIEEAQQWGQRYFAVDPDSAWAKELKKKLSGKDSAER
jgi:tetratricopeptide (TPR) repeat protein